MNKKKVYAIIAEEESEHPYVYGIYKSFNDAYNELLSIKNERNDLFALYDDAIVFINDDFYRIDSTYLYERSINE